MEDPTRDAVVLASADAGDRLLRLLAQHPRRMVVVDRRPIRLYVARLTLAAIKALGHAEYLELMGVRASRRRRVLYGRVRWLLPRDTDDAWLANLGWIDRGLAREVPGLRSQPPAVSAEVFEAAKEAAARAEVSPEPLEQALRRLPDACVDLFALGSLDVRGLEHELARVARRSSA